MLCTGELEAGPLIDADALSQPCDDPDATMESTLQALASANAAKRLELDWRAQNKVQLIAHRFAWQLPTQFKAES